MEVVICIDKSEKDNKKEVKKKFLTAMTNIMLKESKIDIIKYNKMICAIDRL